MLARTGGGLFHMKRTGYSSNLFVVNEAVLVSLRVFSLERSTAGAFVLPFEYDRRHVICVICDM